MSLEEKIREASEILSNTGITLEEAARVLNSKPKGTGDVLIVEPLNYSKLLKKYIKSYIVKNHIEGAFRVETFTKEECQILKELCKEIDNE